MQVQKDSLTGIRPLIGIRGDMGSGKDTLAALIFAEFPEYTVMKWATKLREVASAIIGVPAAQMVSDADKAFDLGSREYDVFDLCARIAAAICLAAGKCIGERLPLLIDPIYKILTGRSPRDSTGALCGGKVTIPLTVGQLLQKLGTECFRGFVGPNVWVEALMRPWKAAGCPPAVIADTRFPNESEAVRAAAGVVVLVRRRDAARADGRSSRHASERALDDELPDFAIDNDASVADLRAALLALWPDILALAASRQ